ncbi:MAG TPA: hypothetical protein VNI83_08570, partial [Vicinamibacterales bacterium]|nr:hypothetical protein [Vicinamibacterales bacterium]
MFAALVLPDASAAGSALVEAARSCSPRVEAEPGGRAVVLDARGLDRLFGGAAGLGRTLLAAARERGLAPQV